MKKLFDAAIHTFTHLSTNSYAINLLFKLKEGRRVGNNRRRKAHTENKRSYENNP